MSSTSSTSSTSSSTSSIYSSTSRITGMFSSMDTDSIVKSLCSPEQTKVDKKYQAKTVAQWKDDALTNIQDAVKDFSNTYASVLGTSSMMSSSTYLSFSVKTADTSGAVSITADSTSSASSVSVSVSQIAKNASVTSTKSVSSGTELASSNTTTLGQLAFANKLTFGSDGALSFSINGKAFKFTSDTTLQSMINTVNSDLDAKVTMKYSRLTDKFTITADEGGADSSLSIQNIVGNAFGTDGAFGIAEGSTSNLTTASQSSSSEVTSGTISASSTLEALSSSFTNALTFDSNNQLSFTVNSKTFTFDKTSTLQSMMDTVNSDSTANVTMAYDSSTKKFTITSDTSGKGGTVTIANVSGNAFGTNSAFGIAEGTTSGTGLTGSEKGQDAKVTIDGTTVTKDSNAFSIDGLTYNISGTTSSAVQFNITRDYSATSDAVQKMVDALNTLITTVNSYTTAKDYSSDYPALTESQRDEMTTDEITKWETKAKSGILRHDSSLESLVTGITNAFFTSAGGTGKAATAIGISTASYFTSSAGQLTLDTDKLKEALAENPDQVLSIFTGGSSTSVSDQQGVMYKLKSAFSTYLDDSKSTLSSLDTEIDNDDDDLTTLKDKLSDAAEKYYNKFSAMETALSKLTSSSNMLSSLFGTSSS